MLVRVQAVIERIMRDGWLDGPGHEQANRLRTVSISAGEAEALKRWVVQEQAAKTIEIGLAYGFSALHICAGLIEGGRSDAAHVVLDPFQEAFQNMGLQALEEAGARTMIEYHAELSQTLLPAFWKEGRQFDFAFVDGNHRFDAVFLDLYYLGRLVKKGGIIVLDDYDLPGIARAVSFYVTNLGWRIEETSPPDDAHAWVVLRMPIGEDTRDFRLFVEF